MSADLPVETLFVVLNDYSEIQPYTEGPYNPLPNPDDESAVEAYEKEYWDVHGRVSKAASKFGRRDQSGDGDFSMNPECFHSRGITILIDGDELHTKDFLVALNSVLQDVEEDYVICAEAYLSTDVYMATTRSCIFGFCKNPDDLAPFGFPIESD